MIHDAGIVTWPGGALVITVLTQRVPLPWHAMDAIAEVAAIIARACTQSG